MAQQDAHEALTYILDLIHNDINRASSNTYHREGPPDATEAMLKHKVCWAIEGVTEVVEKERSIVGD
jgi:ubiquitin C-terminal hydrolase